MLYNIYTTYKLKIHKNMGDNKNTSLVFCCNTNLYIRRHDIRCRRKNKLRVSIEPVCGEGYVSNWSYPGLRNLKVVPPS